LAICGLVTMGNGAVNRLLDEARPDGIARESAGLQASDQQSLSAPSVDTPLQQGEADVYNDLGNLLLAFLMVTTYFAFSQFLIIWSGNQPSEITWYMRRLDDGWQWLALSLVLLHFAAPFLILLARDVKRTPHRLRGIALLLVAMYLAHMYWMIAPALPYFDASSHALNVAALAVLFGGWLAAFFWQARRVLRNQVTIEL